VWSQTRLESIGESNLTGNQLTREVLHAFGRAVAAYFIEKQTREKGILLLRDGTQVQKGQDRQGEKGKKIKSAESKKRFRCQGDQRPPALLLAAKSGRQGHYQHSRPDTCHSSANRAGKNRRRRAATGGRRRNGSRNQVKTKTSKHPYLPCGKGLKTAGTTLPPRPKKKGSMIGTGGKNGRFLTHDVNEGCSRHTKEDLREEKAREGRGGKSSGHSFPN